MIMQYAMKNPNVVFTSPETLETSPEFTSVQKRAILTQWKDQLQQLLIADEESMLRADPTPGTNAECLRRVTDSMRRLSLEEMCGTFPRVDLRAERYSAGELVDSGTMKLA